MDRFVCLIPGIILFLTRWKGKPTLDYMLIGSRYRLTHISTDREISFGFQKISRVKETKTLGVLIDKNITWKNHI